MRLDLIRKSEALKGKGMTVKEISSAGGSLEYMYEPEVLWISVPKVSKNDIRTVVIEYEGILATGLVIGPNKYGDRTFFSDNWPNKARNWLPTVDHPYDKASSEFIVKTPVKYQVVSNGLLLE